MRSPLLLPEYPLERPVAVRCVSFFTGNPAAKQHIFYAVIGAILGFGAQSIVDFIAQTVH